MRIKSNSNSNVGISSSCGATCWEGKCKICLRLMIIETKRNFFNGKIQNNILQTKTFRYFKLVAQSIIERLIKRLKAQLKDHNIFDNCFFSWQQKSKF